MEGGGHISVYLQVMNEVMENGIHIYTGEIDEEDDSTEIRDLKV